MPRQQNIAIRPYGLSGRYRRCLRGAFPQMVGSPQPDPVNIRLQFPTGHRLGGSLEYQITNGRRTRGAGDFIRE